METISAVDIRPAVVLVDDDAAVLMSLKFALEMEGFSVRAYQDAAELLAEADPKRTGCVVLDYHLAGTNGLDLLKELRSVGVSAPAIVMTTNPDPSLRRRAMVDGAAIIEKPLLGNGLIDAVRRSLRAG